MTDLTLKERLREAQLETGRASINNGCLDCGLDGNLLAEAEDRIEALEALVGEMAGALELFKISIQKAALDTEEGHEILDLCYKTYFSEVLAKHREVMG